MWLRFCTFCDMGGGQTECVPASAALHVYGSLWLGLELATDRLPLLYAQRACIHELQSGVPLRSKSAANVRTVGRVLAVGHARRS